MSSQLGNSTTPATGFFFDDVTNSQMWSGTYTMPAGGGTVTDIFVYVGGDSATPTAQLCIWGSSSLLYHSGNITLPSNGRTVGGQSWQHVSGITGLYVPAGTVNIGFWTNGNVVWTYESSGSVNFQRSLSGGPASLSSGGTEGSGALGAYILYTPGGVVRRRHTSAWSSITPKRRHSAAWTTATNTERRHSGGWNPGT